MRRILIPSLACALTLSGCFTNTSGTSTSVSRTNAQVNAPVVTAEPPLDTTPIETTAAVIGSYRDATNTNQIGLLVDLQKTLTSALGAATLQSLLNAIDSNPALQARSVTLHFSTMGFKATTTLGKIAAGNDGRVRNVMNLRPGLTRIDLTTSSLAVPSKPAVLQLKNTHKTVITYGGKIEDDYIRRITVMLPFTGIPGFFLPGGNAAAYGDGYPLNSPEEIPGSVKLLRVTPAIASHFNRIMASAPYGVGPNGLGAQLFAQSPTLVQIASTRESLGLAVHYKVVDGALTTNLAAAYFIHINPDNLSAPEISPLCLAGYDSVDLSFPYQIQTASLSPAGAGEPAEVVIRRATARYSHPLACSCQPATYTYNDTLATAPRPVAADFSDPCPGTANRIPALVADAVTATPPVPALVTMSVSTPTTINDFVLAPERRAFTADN